MSFDELKKVAEIWLAALITETNTPHQMINKFLKLFQQIGENKKVLKTMTMGQTKCKNILSKNYNERFMPGRDGSCC